VEHCGTTTIVTQTYKPHRRMVDVEVLFVEFWRLFVWLFWFSCVCFLTNSVRLKGRVGSMSKMWYGNLTCLHTAAVLVRAFCIDSFGCD
jgi:hypothetical protein